MVYSMHFQQMQEFQNLSFFADGWSTHLGTGQNLWFQQDDGALKNMVIAKQGKSSSWSCSPNLAIQ